MPDPLSDLQRLGQEFDADGVEAVARAIAGAEYGDGYDRPWEPFIAHARAAIAAARPMIEAQAFERAEKACKDQAGKLYARLKKNPHWSEHDVAVFESAISEANELAETIAALIEPQS